MDSAERAALWEAVRARAAEDPPFAAWLNEQVLTWQARQVAAEMDELRREPPSEARSLRGGELWQQVQTICDQLIALGHPADRL